MLNDSFIPGGSLRCLPLTSFIGRQKEVTEVKRLLNTTRLLTLTGAGGCGKTRLASQIAVELSEEFKHGVGWVDLATLADPLLVSRQVASVLGLRERTGYPLSDMLIAYLRRKKLLLVLDGCEHLVEACTELIEELLHACSNLRVLITSRQVLNIAGGITWLVPPLSLPDSDHLPAFEEVTQYEAIQLFVERASAVLPSFMLTKENAEIVVQVCSSLDGIPLAIELAARRVKMLSLKQIAARLDDCWGLLTDGSRTTLPRHQTLRATMDWSYNLLSERERSLFRRLSVFAGGFSLEAAETVCADDYLEKNEIFDLLSHLVDKSLMLVGERNNEARYSLLKVIRRYSRDRLQEVGEGEAVNRSDQKWYLDLAKRGEPELVGSRQETRVDRLVLEHDNQQAVLQWLPTGECVKGKTVLLAQGSTDTLAELTPPRKQDTRLRTLEIALAEVKDQPKLHILALGATTVYQSKRVLTGTDWRYVKAKELLFYLLCHPSKTKEQVGLALWPDASPTQLRSNFHSALYHLRRALGRPEWIVFESNRYSFNRQCLYWFDVEAFEANLVQAQNLRTYEPAQAIYYLKEGVKLYQGDFLHDFFAGNWYLLEQKKLQKMYSDGLVVLGRLFFAEKQYAQATETYQQLIAHDSFLEVAHRELMRCYAHQGERTLALRHYQTLLEMLRDEFGSLPAPETIALFERLRRNEDV